MKLEPKTRLLMIGDSITDCGRNREAAIDDDSSLGCGYVEIVNAVLTAVAPSSEITIINRGVGGNTVRDLKGRWQEDALDHKPDWMSIMIGINDVAQQIGDNPKPNPVEIDEYTKTLDELLTATRPNLLGLVLMTPYYLQSDTQNPMRSLMDSYGLVVRDMAQKHNAIFVDTQAAIDRLIAVADPLSISADRVHVNKVGAMTLAMAFLEGIELDFNALPFVG
ncbi:MAG TPA: GDSL family lipase [Phycisphaerae bacterium]|nr:GDSL family lipase [Phycisphaerae bacterium]